MRIIQKLSEEDWIHANIVYDRLKGKIITYGSRNIEIIAYHKDRDVILVKKHPLTYSGMAMGPTTKENIMPIEKAYEIEDTNYYFWISLSQLKLYV